MLGSDFSKIVGPPGPPFLYRRGSPLVFPLKFNSGQTSNFVYSAKKKPLVTSSNNMTTPGRTHISWQDQTGQLHELISYIGYLEAKLQYLQYHHEHCGTPLAAPFAMDVDLSYLPPEIIVDKESQNEPISSFAPGTIDSAPKPTTAVPASQKGPDGNPRWKRIVDQMTKGWDKPSSWADKRRAINLDSVDKNQYALTVILGLKKDLPQSLYQSQLLDQTEPSASPADALIFSARMYALDTKASEKNAGFVVQIHNFRELVFASLCVVMEQQGLPIDTINDLMRICMSSSGPANLYRLRRGALWVNRVIAGMIRKGWHHGATEFFLLCKIGCRNMLCNSLTKRSWKTSISVWAALGSLCSFISLFE